MNRLAKEKSPYLLQHATNPVDWYPWGEEAFQKSRAENKPIFLSIGYSTCHWCHVMEEESFVNPEIAKMLNDHFVSIKVDREERPDIDHIYMQAVMALTGSGGWPMSVFLTPERKPFYGGTYFPPTDKWGRPGFVTVLKAISDQWVSRHDALVQAGDEIAKAISPVIPKQTESRLKNLTQTVISERFNRGSMDSRFRGNDTTALFSKAFEQLEEKFDSERGGFSAAPKFPQSHVLSFLLRYSSRTKEPGASSRTALEMATRTLDEMAKGGMYDQIGGGFHRYSTDSAWRVPHFEKMLYDQALLSKAYLEAYQFTHKKFYAEVARDILNYVLTKADPLGGFYSAEDADSAPDSSRPNQKSEGAYYLWSIQEIEQALGRNAAAIFNFHFGVLPEGNAPEDPQNEFRGKNILYAAHSAGETAREFKRSEQEISRLLEESKRKLNEIRSKRLKPHLDDKVLTDWNGLMISSLAFGSRVLGEPKFLAAAQKAADFILSRMIHPSPLMGEGRVRVIGRLMHRYRDAEVSISGFLEDYAFFILGLLDLYEASFDVRYLKEAKRLAAEMIRLFWDEALDGFFLTASDAEALISRPKEFYDGAVPSGNSVAALCLLRLARMSDNSTMSSPNDIPFENYAEKIWGSISSQIVASPSAFAQMLMALDFHLGPSREVVVAGRLTDPDMTEALRKIFSHFIPNKVVLYYPHSFLKQLASDGKVTVYVCVNQTCQLPLTDLSTLDTVLNS